MEATLQSIFRGQYSQYREKKGLSVGQLRAAEAILLCQSEHLGFEEWACDHDQHVEREPHGCRNRSCPAVSVH